MKIKWLSVACLGLLLIAAGSAGAGELIRLPLDQPPAHRTEVSLDQTVKTEGRASLKVTTPGPASVCLAEVQGPDIDNALLIYRAKVKSQGLVGSAFLEMWVYLPDSGPFFGRGLHKAITGDSDWQDLEAIFQFRQGQRPSRITLNINISGAGTVWVDDIRLIKQPN